MRSARICMRSFLIALLLVPFAVGISLRGDRWGVAAILGSAAGMIVFCYVLVPLVRRVVFAQRRRELDPALTAWEFDPRGSFNQALISDLVRGLEHLYRIPAGTLRGSDRFAEELCILGPGWGFDHADEDRFDWAGEHTGQVIPSLGDCSTAGEFISAIASRIKQAAPPSN